MLIKNKVSKNTVALLGYLRDRFPGDLTEIEWEVAEINKRLSGRVEKKRKEEVPDYEFNDPFKPRVDTYNRREYNKHVKGSRDNQQEAREKIRQVSDRNNFGIGERERQGGRSNQTYGHGRHRYGQEQVRSSV